MRPIEIANVKFRAAKTAAARRPNITLLLFVIIVLAVAGLGYLRYEHVQAEIAAQQNLLTKVHKGVDRWTDDLSMRFGHLKESLLGPVQGAKNIAGGAWGIVCYLVTAVLYFIGTLHIMIPVTIIYFGVGFFGTLKMRVATLIGALIGFWVSTSTGIVPGSVIGLLAVAGLLFWNKIDARLLTKIQELPKLLKTRLQKLQTRSNEDLAGAPDHELAPILWTAKLSNTIR